MVIRTLRWALMVSVLILLMLPGPASRPSRADTAWYVAPTGSDSNTCLSPAAPCASISGALAKAGFAPGDTIRVAVGTYTGEGEAVVTLDKNAALSGGWDAAFATQGGVSVIDGQQQAYITGLRVNEGVAATVERLVVRNAGAWGISVSHGTLVLHDSVLTNNGLGGITNDGTLIVERCTLEANTCIGVHNDGGTVILTQARISGNGCAINNWGSMTLNDCTITGSTGSGCGYAWPSAISNRGAMSLNNSTVIDNRVVGILAQGGRANVNNSTVTGNVGGLQSSGDAEVTLSNCTVTDNRTSNIGGGIYVEGGTFTLRNSIVAGNDARERPNCVGAIGSAGYNLIGDTSGCGYTPGQGDLTDVDPRLGALIGGPGRARYYPLLEGSPAIDAGDPQGCLGSDGLLTTDQRGAPRVGRCDIGAYEYTTPGPPASIHALHGAPQRTPPLSRFWSPLQALVLDSAGAPVSGAEVAFSAPASGASGAFADSGSHLFTRATNESGIAGAAFTANELQGSYVVTATVSAVAPPADFPLSNSGWYVAPQGSDNDACSSPSSACATMGAVFTKPGFLSGDTVLVASGTYTQGAQLVKSVILSGGWNAGFTLRDGVSVVDGQDAQRGFSVDWGVNAVIDRINILHCVGYEAGGIINRGVLLLSNSAVSGNKGGFSGGISSDGFLTVNNSTVSSNGGNGISQSGGILVLNNTTVSYNLDIGIYSSGLVSLNSCTLSRNIGRGLSGGNPNLQNTIIAGNGSCCCFDARSRGYNLIGESSACSFVPAVGDLVDVDARLFPALLGSPGYHPLLPGSAAIDAGNPAGCTDDEGSILATDERGVPRLGRCDIGAYEYDPRYDPLLYLGLPMALRGAP